MEEKPSIQRIAMLCNCRITQIKSSSVEKDACFPTYRVYVKGPMVHVEDEMNSFKAMCQEQGMSVDVTGPRCAIVDQAPDFTGTDCSPCDASF